MHRSNQSSSPIRYFSFRAEEIKSDVPHDGDVPTLSAVAGVYEAILWHPGMRLPAFEEMFERYLKREHV